jgi:basic amino acid/polyamine antiporter, APA family
MDLMRKKDPAHLWDHQHTSLKKCLSAFDLTLFGVGAIIGAGIFVLTGIAAATKAGPGIVVSYIIAGLACGFSALAYAELAASVGGCGSAYGYAYAGIGEFFAWLIGWDLLLEYAVSVATVSVGWSSYVNDFLISLHVHLPPDLVRSPFSGGILNLPAMLVVLALTFLLMAGVKESARFNNAMVVIKLLVIILFIAIAAFNVNPANWRPFLPYGWSGVMGGAALIFFAYIGFDSVSTAAEEATNPQRDLPIGIIMSLLICTGIYIIVAGLLTGILPYPELNVSSPVSFALLKIGHRTAAAAIGAGAIAGLTTVMLVMYYGLSRVFLAMSRDRLIPAFFSKLNSTTQTPFRILFLCGVIICIFSALVPIQDLAELVNIGTLAAFITVCVGVIVLRHTQPGLRRPFRTPLSPYVPFLGILFCLYLICNLPLVTILRFVSWMLLGFAVYFLYSKKRSLLNKN